jgi:hypothetical protein
MSPCTVWATKIYRIWQLLFLIAVYSVHSCDQHTATVLAAQIEDPLELLDPSAWQCRVPCAPGHGVTSHRNSVPVLFTGWPRRTLTDMYINKENSPAGTQTSYLQTTSQYNSPFTTTKWQTSADPQPCLSPPVLPTS